MKKRNHSEMMDIVNEKDQVIGKALKKEIYDKLLTHRIAHIFIFNKKGEILLQLRSRKMNFCPLHWSHAVGGHVRAGESFKEAALRELHEELGIDTKIDFLYKDIYKDKRGHTKILTTFKAMFNGPFKINSKEVERVEFFSLNKIEEMIKNGDKFHPELLFLLRKHFNII